MTHNVTDVSRGGRYPLRRIRATAPRQCPKYTRMGRNGHAPHARSRSLGDGKRQSQGDCALTEVHSQQSVIPREEQPSVDYSADSV